MSIQQDILDTIGNDGIEIGALKNKVGNIGANELDCAVTALIRARRLRVAGDRYEVIPSTRAVGTLAPIPPPSADEEASASLLPTRVCITCKGPPQALCEFRFVGPGDVRAKECNRCHGKRVRAGQSKQRGQPKVSSQSAVNTQALSAAPTITPREGDNRAVSTERCQLTASVPETSGSYLSSGRREDAPTPAGAGIASPPPPPTCRSMAAAARIPQTCDLRSPPRRPPPPRKPPLHPA